MRSPSPRVHLACMSALRLAELADPGRPLSVYYATARATADAWAPGWGVDPDECRGHLLAGCPRPMVLSTLPSLLGAPGAAAGNVHA